MKATALLLTGSPGVGKTTALRRVVSALSDKPSVLGFYTAEIRERGRRVGFRITSLDESSSSILAHSEMTAAHRVGHYGVDVAAVDEMTRKTLTAEPHADIYFVDEIGKMECFSSLFTRAVIELLDLRFNLVATISLKGGGFISQVKGHPNVELREVTRGNRDDVPGQVIEWLTQRVCV